MFDPESDVNRESNRIVPGVVSVWCLFQDGTRWKRWQSDDGSATCRFCVAHNAKLATDAIDHCTLLHAESLSEFAWAPPNTGKEPRHAQISTWPATGSILMCRRHPRSVPRDSSCLLGTRTFCSFSLRRALSGSCTTPRE